MNLWICLLALAVLGSNVAVGAPEENLTYYVQLVRGNDEGKPPVAGARLIGPKLSKSLHSVFRWKNYWEVSRREVVVAVGAKTKVLLNKERALEIDLRTRDKRKVTAFSDGNPVATLIQPIGNDMTIIGADRGVNSAWFIVVRRDKPTTD